MNDMTRPTEQATFPALLSAYKGEIARALPKHMDGDRMARIALTEFRKNPALAKCEPRSVFAAVIVASQLGLEPGVMGQAYLVPTKNNRTGKYECNLIPGWQGLSDLATRTGRASVWTGAVFRGDEFEYAQGDRPFITHRRGDEEESEQNLTHVYAVGRIKNAEWPIVEVWSVAKVKRHRDRYNKVGEKHYSFDNLEMYGRKVALLQVLKYMPKSPELAQAVDLQHAQGRQNLDDAKSVIEGTWAVGADEEPEAATEKPGYSAEAFAKNLPGWRELIASGKRSAADIIATAEAKGALTEEQKAQISAPQNIVREPDAPASADAIVAMQEKAEAAALTDREVAKHLGVKSIKNLTNAQVALALAFIANPTGGAQ